MIPTTEYAHASGAEIAYRIVGDGPRDIVFTLAFASHLDVLWEIPEYVEALERLGRLGRIIAYDKRGTGLSDRQLGDISAHDRCDDVIAVMDAAGSQEAVLFGWMDSGAISLLTAALHPDRVTAVIAGEVMAVAHAEEGGPPGVDPGLLDQLITVVEGGGWGRGLLTTRMLPHVSLSTEQLAAIGRIESRAATPRAAARLIRMHADLDLRPYLSQIRCPVLLLHEVHFPLVSAQGMAWLADQLPSGTLRILDTAARPGAVLPLEVVSEEVAEFLVGTRVAPLGHRRVLSLLFTDVVGSTAAAAAQGDHAWKHVLASHRGSVRACLVRFGGTEVNTTGDGFLASFDLPSMALRCAAQVVAEARDLGIEVRAGVHAGEVTLEGADLVGLAVHIAARVAAQAGPSEILLTDTVRTLVPAADFACDEVGERALKGVPGQWRLFRLTDIHAARSARHD
jgi:class 3 adenylate cyclase